jgi:hypothetical protein
MPNGFRDDWNRYWRHAQYFPVHWSMESPMHHVMKSGFATVLLIITGIPVVSAAGDPLLKQAQALFQPIPETAPAIAGVPMTADRPPKSGVSDTTGQTLYSPAYATNRKNVSAVRPSGAGDRSSGRSGNAAEG